MTDRERWIVYPLLFLALGAALRDKLIKQTVADRVQCKELYIVDDDGAPLTVFKGDQFVVFNAEHRRVASLSGGQLQVESLAAQQVNAVNLIQQAKAQAADSMNWQVLEALLRRAGLPIGPPRAPAANPPAGEPADEPSDAQGPVQDEPPLKAPPEA